MNPTRWLLLAALATWLFWLGYCVVILEMHGRLNVQHGKSGDAPREGLEERMIPHPPGLGRDWENHEIQELFSSTALGNESESDGTAPGRQFAADTLDALRAPVPEETT